MILFSVLVSISVLTINSYGQGGSATKTPPPPSTKKTPARSTASKRTGRPRQSNTSSPQTDSQQADSQPTDTSSTSNANVSATPATTPAPIESPSAPPEPTLNETLDWIGNKLSDLTFISEIKLIGPATGNAPWDEKFVSRNQFGSDSLANNTPYQIIRCNVELNWTTVAYRGITRDYLRQPTDNVRLIIPLADIDPNSIKIGDTTTYALDMNTSNSKQTIKYISSVGEYSRAQIIIFATSYENAKRLEKAFKHAVQLCGGKSDAF